ncbi:MAG: hypothetical protein RMM06_04025 [Armatimonadota bacterium]|nr:hypothetical protein [bacterium]MCS6950760.1 hypothetical protein [bacterium]MDW8105498.1 hypothetical protein [Armatimonadota bacterium]MDW8289864.1 hypothetical protein [Armatimonadota bacterium]
METTVVDQIVERVKSLPIDLQLQVLQFASWLASPAQAGVPGERLLKFAGIIPPDDIERMRQAIEEGCERVDEGEW